MELTITSSRLTFVQLAFVLTAFPIATMASLPYGILVPYPFGVQDPLESPRQMKDLSMGDLILTARQTRAWKYGLSMSSFSRIGKVDGLRWQNATIPFEIDCSLKNMPRALDAIEQGMNEWKKKTCIKFKKRTGEKDYLLFFRDSHCWSNVGRIGGASRISVGYGCEHQKVITHAIGHILGLWHQQNRMDRNKYLRIFWQNVNSYTRMSFRRVEDAETLSGQYDYSSIMHYPWDAFSNSGRRTMLPLQRVEKEPYKEISDLDALKISNLYGCFLSEMKVEFVSHRLRRNIPSPSSRDCRDRNLRCPEWASAGYCRRNRYVIENCKTSCKVPCGVQRRKGNCSDSYQSCAVWSKAGFCSRAIIAKACKLSCDPACRDKVKCKDLHVYCKRTAEQGKCGIPWFKKTCSLSCNPECGAKRQKKARNPECKDKYAFCSRWFALGYCKKFLRARKLCAGSCKPECRKAMATKKPTTASLAYKGKKAMKVGTRFKPVPNVGGYGKGVLCIDRNVKCDESQCVSDAWTRENCKKTCKMIDCDEFIPMPPGSCSKPLGMSFNGGDFQIPDSAFTSSSHFKSSGWRAGPQNARLYLVDDQKSKRIGAWCASISEKGNSHWLQVDLGQLKTIFYIATQGRDKHFERVAEYNVSYSYNGRSFRKYAEHGRIQTFKGNCDHFTPKINKFARPFRARYVRVYPTKFNFPCMRMELYGC